MTRYATPKQILEAFQAMTPTEHALLLVLAAISIEGTCFTDPMDLIHETLYQCINGRHKWALPDSEATVDTPTETSREQGNDE